MEEPAIIMHVHTTFVEPGYNIGISRRDANINLTITYTDTDNNELGKITVTKSPGRLGMGMDFDTGLRIQEAYAKAAKELAKYYNKKVLK